MVFDELQKLQDGLKRYLKNKKLYKINQILLVEIQEEFLQEEFLQGLELQGLEIQEEFLQGLELIDKSQVITI